MRKRSGLYLSEMNITIKLVISWAWEILKVAVIPLAIWYFETKREREYTDRKREIDEQTKRNINIQYLLMQRIDKLSELTHLMAVRLHEKKIINGDLEALDKKYKELDAEYEEEVKRLALLHTKGKII